MSSKKSSSGTAPDHFLGGYYLVQGESLEHNPLLPSPFWSLGGCLCPIFPGRDGLSWAKGDARAQKEYRNRLRLSEAQYEELQAWTDELFNSEEMGWPDVFLSLDAARRFGERYLRGISNIKLLSIALPAAYLDEALAQMTPDGNVGEPGLVVQLRRRLPFG